MTGGDEPGGHRARLVPARVVAASLAGLGVGVIGSLFGLALDQANRLRDALIAQSRPLERRWGFVLTVALAAGAAALAAGLVRRVAPGMQEAAFRASSPCSTGRAPPAPAERHPVKFVAGTLAIGSGLTLPSAGIPTVQMGATFRVPDRQVVRTRWIDGRALMAAGAGAGFAVAFKRVTERSSSRWRSRGFRGADPALSRAGVLRRPPGSGARSPEPMRPSLRCRHCRRQADPACPCSSGSGIAAGLAGVLYSGRCSARFQVTDRLPGLPVEETRRDRRRRRGRSLLSSAAPLVRRRGLAQRALSGRGTPAVLTLLFLFRLGLIPRAPWQPARRSRSC